MSIQFDPAKDASNIAKHGVSLALAAVLEWDTALIWSDTRRDYGEPRMSSLVLLGTRLYSVVFVDRADQRRIISVRKANNREKKRYVQEISNDR